jgi:hypothetical protein
VVTDHGWPGGLAQQDHHRLPAQWQRPVRIPKSIRITSVGELSIVLSQKYLL